MGGKKEANGGSQRGLQSGGEAKVEQRGWERGGYHMSLGHIDPKLAREFLDPPQRSAGNKA